VTLPFLNEPLTPLELLEFFEFLAFLAFLESEALSAATGLVVLFGLLPDELSSVPFWHAVISRPAVSAAVATTAWRRRRFITGGSFRRRGERRAGGASAVSRSVINMRSPRSRRSRLSSLQNSAVTQP
jgi:hypothetical protein